MAEPIQNVPPPVLIGPGVPRLFLLSTMEERSVISQRSSWIARFQLPLFFVLTYAIVIAGMLVSGYWPKIPISLVRGVQILSPTISGLILTFAIGGTDGVKSILLRFLKWKVSPLWYIAASALLWIPLLFGLVYTVLGFPAPGLAAGLTPLFLIGQIAFTLYSGPLAEEAGWRGFALPRLQQRFGALTSSLILGVLWACWHLPFYGQAGGGAGIPFPAYAALVLVVSIFITWIYNNTGGSLLLCVLAHFSFNASSAFVAGYLGLLPPMVFNIACSVALTGLIVAIVLYYGPKRLVRQKRAVALAVEQ
jgi:uncharacterized protein